ARPAVAAPTATGPPAEVSSPPRAGTGAPIPGRATFPVPTPWTTGPSPPPRYALTARTPTACGRRCATCGNGAPTGSTPATTPVRPRPTPPGPNTARRG